ncbi:DUF6382 domain-containing protein [Saccharibacillus kuerlensis]|uniref:FHA domain-containing protein n=1 Tax=Saccharibacillus kuerlensis TaxID=459527 RepID=A0ABQ2L1B9_9BACL|nr:DUF6382 domain-containing protein [Saccharibacillus kuerlensis]GGN99428.1 hypothetical protein GCM10010969_19530 [Saccharibacillus kuerlensis]
MEDFVTDFIQKDTTYMVIKSKQKLGGERLNRVQVKMLASSNVPHVLDLHVREVDAEAELHYNIGGKRMLSTCMKTEKITLVEYYALLLQIVTALEYGMTYMLNPNGFLLKENYMFVDGPLSEGTIYLTYLPLNKTAEIAPIRERIGGLASRWMTTIDDLRGSGVQRILQMCEQPSFSLQALKSLLIGLLAGSGKRTTGGLEAAGAAAPKPFPPMENYSETRGGGDGGNGGYESWTSRPPERTSAESFSQAFPQASPEGEEQITERRKPMGSTLWQKGEGSGQRKLQNRPNPAAEPAEEGAEENKNGRLVAPLISLLLLAVLWKMLYLENPSKIALLICVVATPLLLVFAYLGWTRKLKFGGRRVERLQEEEEAAALESSWQEPKEVKGHRMSYGVQQNGRSSAIDESLGAAKKWGMQSSPQPEVQERHIPSFLRPASSYDREPSEGRYAMTDSAVSGMQMQIEEHLMPAAAGGTGILAAPAAQPTVLLDGDRGAAASANMAGVSAVTTSYRLERLESGSLPKSISLPLGSFTIGRSDEVSQHIETAVGISRAHVELELSEGQCLIKDIGSRNGTFLNEEALTPYKAYELHEGDTFKIAGISYTLRCG